jgi:hypothetical protein
MDQMNNNQEAAANATDNENKIVVLNTNLVRPWRRKSAGEPLALL